MKMAKRTTICAGIDTADPNYQLLAIGADAALTYFRWLLSRRIVAGGNTARAA